MILRPALAADDDRLVCALSTRIGGVSGGSFGMNLSFSVGDDPAAVEENRRRFFGAAGVPLDRVVFQRQVHGDTVRHVQAPGVMDATDGICTATADLYLCVTIADCVPVFLYDPEAQAVAVVHAGWRGTVAGIVSSGVAAMVRELGAQPARIRAYIGPSAGVCCYTVGEEVFSRLPASCVIEAGDGRKADLKNANRELLMGCGVRDEAIIVDRACTICGSDLYHSHRREGAASGRMMGVIGLRRVG
ncbi:MAG: peptidoglycan editing factor PgeF [Ignavibacteriae bacterium]|nr:peptidoglycan editing factor PgeF [Ignavibacteriota bacterium]